MPKKAWRPSLAMVLILVALACVVSYGLARVFSQNFSKTMRSAVVLPCSPSDNIQIHRDQVVYYDGSSLRGVNRKGGQEWDYPLGTGADFLANEYGITAWAGRKLVLLSPDGKRQLFNREAEASISAAVVGQSYVAVHMQSEGNSFLQVYDHAFRQVDRITIENKLIMDFGFFQEGNMLWVMTLDTDGTVPLSQISTYQPNRSSRQVIGDSEQVIYKALFGSRQIQVVGTTHVKVYQSRGDEIADRRALVYGWKLLDAYPSGEEYNMLFAPTAQADGAYRVQDVRVLGQTERTVHIPVPCMKVELFGDTLYGFTEQYVFVARPGKKAEPFLLPIKAEAVLGITGARDAVIQSQGAVYLVHLGA